MGEIFITQSLYVWAYGDLYCMDENLLCEIKYARLGKIFVQWKFSAVQYINCNTMLIFPTAATAAF